MRHAKAKNSQRKNTLATYHMHFDERGREGVQKKLDLCGVYSG